MNILFMHNNFPGQYRRIAKYLKANTNYRMAVATLASNEQNIALQRLNYTPHRDPTKGVHPSVFRTEKAALMGQAAFQALYDAKRKGARPDIILSHSGWGASLFLKDLFPDAKFLSYFEWYYHGRNSDSDFLSDEPLDPNTLMSVRMNNTAILQDLAAMDWGQCPTQFQLSQFPERFRRDISVLHDGVECNTYRPNSGATITVADGKTLTAKDEVVTYVARGMEEYRGFPQFMQMVERLQKVRPNMHAVVLGNDRVAYGKTRDDGRSFKTWALEELDLDLGRVHFMGLMPFDYFRALMQVSSVHVYLTVPFVLSWSLMEAMSTGCLIVGSNTGPLREMVTHEQNGLLTSFFDVEALADMVNDALEHQDRYEPLRRAARAHIVDKYNVDDLLPRFRQLIENVANGSQKPLD